MPERLFLHLTWSHQEVNVSDNSLHQELTQNSQYGGHGSRQKTIGAVEGPRHCNWVSPFHFITCLMFPLYCFPNSYE